MDTNLNDAEIRDYLKERFKALPRPVQNAIVSADVEKRLRELAGTHQLHIDQWEALENEVQLTLLGIQPSEELAANIEKEVGVPKETAAALAVDIARIVFEPIREELERELDHPSAKPVEETAVEAARAQTLAQEGEAPAPEAVAAAAAPSTPPEEPALPTAVRAAIPAAYAPGAPSHERKAVDGDPYREQLL